MYNDTEVKAQYKLPDTPIETDSYVAVQMLEQYKTIDSSTLKEVSEAMRGSFVFTILRDDNTLFLVRGNNPITLYYYPELGLYVYASTKEILDKALKLCCIKGYPISYKINEGDIVRIDADGEISVTQFTMNVQDPWLDWWKYYRSSWMPEDDICSAEILDICGYYGIEKEDVELLLSVGYTVDEIEEMLADTDYFEAAINEAKTLYEQ